MGSPTGSQNSVLLTGFVSTDNNNQCLYQGTRTIGNPPVLFLAKHTDRRLTATVCTVYVHKTINNHIRDNKFALIERWLALGLSYHDAVSLKLGCDESLLPSDVAIATPPPSPSAAECQLCLDHAKAIRSAATFLCSSISMHIRDFEIEILMFYRIIHECNF